MQNAALQLLALPYHYELWHTPAADLPARIESLRAPDIGGANVTLPHKTAVATLVDECDPTAQLIGAVNTVYKDAAGRLHGANTDAPGLLADLAERADFAPAGRRVVLLGASGAARGAAFALLFANVRQLVIANRTPARAEDLLADMLAALTDAEDTASDLTSVPDPRLYALGLDDPDLPAMITDCDLLLNATAVGWHDDATPLPDPPVTARTLVYDMVYRETRLLHEAAARGARTLDGLGMLVHQGALAFTLWTGQPAPLAVMWQAVRQP